MPEPIPQPTRDAIIADREAGNTTTVVAVRHGVSPAIVRRLVQRHRETGTAAPLPHAGGRSPAIQGKTLSRLKLLVRRKPDATVQELADTLGRTTAAVCRALQREGLPVREGRYTQSQRHRFRSPVTTPIFETKLGKLYEADTLTILPTLATESFDLVFADPPFNLAKRYGRRGDDDRPEAEYLAWCHQWLGECGRVVKPGGALVLWHIPRVAAILATHLMTTGWAWQNWIAVDYNLGPSTSARLTPRHYSLTYFTRGERRTFNVQRLPIQTCRHCGKDVRDYGGHRHEVHRDGVRLTDVWSDISAVRHNGHRHRRENALPEKLVRRVIDMTTNRGNLVLDVFAGSGSVPAVAEATGRRWVAVEIEATDVIVRRISGLKDTQTRQATSS